MLSSRDPNGRSRLDIRGWIGCTGPLVQGFLLPSYVCNSNPPSPQTATEPLGFSGVNTTVRDGVNCEGRTSLGGRRPYGK